MRLIHGEALEVLASLPDNSVDAVITDPPYGTTKARWDTVIDLDEMWKQLKRVTKPRAAVVLFASQPFTSQLVMSNVKNFKYVWTWDKITGVGHLVAKKRPMQQSEDVCVFAWGAHNYYPQMVERERPLKGRKWAVSDSDLLPKQKMSEEKVVRTHKYPKTILKFKPLANVKNKLHPTQKPVDLLEYLVLTYTKPGETILDFTMGSGSTGVAAQNLGRKFIGIELDEHYFNVAKERIESEALPVPRAGHSSAD